MLNVILNCYLSVGIINVNTIKIKLCYRFLPIIEKRCKVCKKYSLMQMISNKKQSKTQKKDKLL